VFGVSTLSLHCHIGLELNALEHDTWRCQLHAPTALLSVKSPRYSLDKELGEPQRLFGRGGGDKSRSQWRGSWPVGCWDRGFESRSKHGCLSASFCVVLSCVGRGLATG
jgi:hypothetical protein